MNLGGNCFSDLVMREMDMNEMILRLNDKYIEGALLPVACGGPQCHGAYTEQGFEKYEDFRFREWVKWDMR
jgi:hypothetical protein